MGEIFLWCFGEAVGLGEAFRFGLSEGLVSASPGRAEARPAELGDGDATFFSFEGTADFSGVGVGEIFSRSFGDSDGLGFGFTDGRGDGDATFFVDVVLR